MGGGVRKCTQKCRRPGLCVAASLLFAGSFSSARARRHVARYRESRFIFPKWTKAPSRCGAFFFVRTLAFRLSRFIKLDAAILGTAICSVVGRNRVAVAIPLGREIAGLVASGIYVTSKNMAPFEGAMSCLLHLVTIFRWLRKCPLHPCRCRYTSSPCRISVCGDAYRAITLQHESHRLRQADDPAQSRRRAD